MSGHIIEQRTYRGFVRDEDGHVQREVIVRGTVYDHPEYFEIIVECDEDVQRLVSDRIDDFDLVQGLLNDTMVDTLNREMT